MPVKPGIEPARPLEPPDYGGAGGVDCKRCDAALVAPWRHSPTGGSFLDAQLPLQNGCDGGFPNETEKRGELLLGRGQFAYDGKH